VIAATMSVLRTFFNIVPFAVRARQSQPTGVGWVLCPCGIAAFGTCQAVLARQRGPDLPGGCDRRPRRLLKLKPSAAPLTRGSVDSIFVPELSG
jgi:hypothetical protein